MRQSFYNRGFTHPRLSNQNRVVFGTARQNVQYPANFLLPPDNRIKFAVSGAFIEVYGIFVQRIVRFFRALARHSVAFPQVADSRFQGFFLYAAVFQHLGNRVFCRQDRQQQVLQRNVLISEFFQCKVRALNGFIHLPGKVLTFRRSGLGIGLYNAVRGLFYGVEIDAQFFKKKRRNAIIYL